MSRRGRRTGPKRSYTLPIAVTLVVITGVVGYYIFTSSGISASSPYIGQAASSTVLDDLNNVSITTLNTVGSGASGVVSPVTTASSSTGALPPALTSGGKPEVLYIGAEYCPFCGAERWSIIVALDKFGSFTGIEYMQSAASPEVDPNTSTFTFQNASYSSSYISFVAVEQKDRSENPLMTPTANETALMTQYDSASSIPFIDIGNQYVQVGAQYQPPNLRIGQSATGAPYNWTQIASQVNNPSSVFALYIDGAANRLISAICKIDSDQPPSVCNQTLASTLSYTRGSPLGGSQLAVSDEVLTGPLPQVSRAASFTPTRVTAWV